MLVLPLYRKQSIDLHSKTDFLKTIKGSFIGN